MIDYIYKPIQLSERKPILLDYIHERLVMLDDLYNVHRVVLVGFATDIESISVGSTYWLEKTEIPHISQIVASNNV